MFKTSESLKVRKVLIFQHFNFYEQTLFTIFKNTVTDFYLFHQILLTSLTLRYYAFNSLHGLIILHAFLSSTDFFFKINIRKCYWDNHQSVKLFRSRSGPTKCRPDLDPNCWQR